MQDDQLTTMQPLIGCGMSPSPPPQSPLWSPNSSSEEESDNPDAELSDDPNSAPTFDLSFDPDTAELSDDPGMDTAPTLELSDNSDKDTTPTPEPSDEAVEMHEEGLSINAGYKIVFDNIDKNVKPRYMRSDCQTHSLHCVHGYGVKDRIDFSEYSDVAPQEVNAFDVIPTEEDYKSLKNDFSVLVSRAIVKFLPFFSSDYKDLAQSHIPHRYSKEMSAKSEVVSILTIIC